MKGQQLLDFQKFLPFFVESCNSAGRSRNSANESRNSVGKSRNSTKQSRNSLFQAKPIFLKRVSPWQNASISALAIRWPIRCRFEHLEIEVQDLK